MTTPPFEDLLAEALLDYEAARESSHSTASAPPSTADVLPAELLERLKRDKACIDLLRDLREEFTQEDRLGGDLASTFVSAPNQVEAPAQRIGRFEILETLGAGGFGIVYRAFDPRTKREVALKIPRFETLASEELRQRFEQEAWAAARLNHENIVSVLEAGNERLVPYIAAVYYRGVTLASWLQEHPGPIDPRGAAMLMRRLVDGVAHAHQHGVQHRDIKPSNILLVPRVDGQPVEKLDDVTPKLTDFGLAKVAGEGQDMTRSGAILGTARYMAPEQAAGRTRDIGPAADIYSLGAVLYELLAGKPLFAGESDLDVLRRIYEDEPSRLRSGGRSISRDLETICLKCLAKEPAGRYPSAQSLADDLARYLEGAPIHARPIGTPERVRKWIRRYPALAALGVAVCLAACTTIANLVWSNRAVRAERDRATANELRATESAQLARTREIEAINHAYSFDMRQAHDAWASNALDRSREILDRYLPARIGADLRDFAWWCLDDQLHRSNQILTQHRAGVAIVASSRDGRMLATAGVDGLIRVWDSVSSALLIEINGHHGVAINGLAFSPDGKLLASAGDDAQVALWSIPEGKLERRFFGGFGWVATVAFSPDGQQMAAAGSDKLIRIWDLKSGKLFASLKGHTDVVRSLVFSEFGNLFSTGEDYQVRAWDLALRGPDPRCPEGKLPRPGREGGIVIWLALDVDGKSLIGSGWDSGYERWNIEREGFGTTLANHGGFDHPRRVVSDRPGMLIFGESNGTVQFLCTAEGANVPMAKLRGPHHTIFGLVSLPEQHAIVAGFADGSVRRFASPILGDSKLNAAAQDFDCIDWRGDLVAARSRELKHVTVTDLAARKTLAIIPTVNAAHVQVAPHSERVMILEKIIPSGRLSVYSTSGVSQWSVDMKEGSTDFALDHGEQRIAVADRRTLLILDSQQGEVLFRCEHPDSIDEIEFETTRPYVVTTARDAMIRIWNAETGELVEEHLMPHNGDRKLSLAPDGQRVLVTCGGRIAVYDRESWKCLVELPDRDGVGTPYLIDEGRSIALSGESGLTIWRVSDGAEILDMRTAEAKRSVARSEDGYRLLVKCLDAIEIYDGRPRPSGDR
jgi:serine/threonine protein kinase/WD40 repeat protein